MRITRWLAQLEQTMVQHLTTFFAMMGEGEAPEFWHEREDLKPIPIQRDAPKPRQR
jgi:hypothetical protein